LADIVDKATRSRMMSGIRSRNTRPEMKVRSALHRAGFRFRLHAQSLPGKPDLVFPKHRVVLFVHGCYWHRHEGCRIASTPSTNREFWVGKFEANIMRDRQARQALLAAGWRVAVVWECATRKMPMETIASNVGEWLKGGDATFEIPESAGCY
jgi:DNA mismatch endonuclease, patch repair protein